MCMKRCASFTFTRARRHTFSPWGASPKLRQSAACFRKTNTGFHRSDSPLFELISKGNSCICKIQNKFSCAHRVTRVHFTQPARANIWRSRSIFSVDALQRGGREELSNHVNAAPPIVLAIGGFDPSAGAGVAADLKTF